MEVLIREFNFGQGWPLFNAATVVTAHDSLTSGHCRVALERIVFEITSGHFGGVLMASEYTFQILISSIHLINKADHWQR